MSARLAVLVALALGGCAPATSAPAPAATPAAGKTLAAACQDRDGWSDAAPPAKIYGNTYYVGTCGITVLLVDTPAGLVLIDGATEKAVPSILANIRALGFDPATIKILLSSHEHIDHAGGLKALRAATGAKLFARAEAAEALTSGEPHPTDPQRGSLSPFEGVPVSRTVRDGEVLQLPGVRMTAHATPGHTPGGTSWTWQSCEGADCRTIAYVDSLRAFGAEGYRFSDHPDYVAVLRATHAKVPSLPCDILISPHPAQSNLFARLAGEAPLVDPGACGPYAEAARKALDERLAKEGAPQ